MLKLRGGKENLGMRGMLKNWLNVCHGPWSEGCAYAPVFTILHIFLRLLGFSCNLVTRQ